jgi:hypothetical protein
MNSETDSKFETFGSLQTLIQVSHRSEDTQASPYSALRIVFMGLGIAKVHQETIAQKLSNVPVIASNHRRTSRVIRLYHVPVFFGVEPP